MTGIKRPPTQDVVVGGLFLGWCGRTLLRLAFRVGSATPALRRPQDRADRAGPADALQLALLRPLG